jgi:hypothetical protein
MEMTELFPSVAIYSASKEETGCIAPQDLVENSTVTRLQT